MSIKSKLPDWCRVVVVLAVGVSYRRAPLPETKTQPNPADRPASPATTPPSGRIRAQAARDHHMHRRRGGVGRVQPLDPAYRRPRRR